MGKYGRGAGAGALAGVVQGISGVLGSIVALSLIPKAGAVAGLVTGITGIIVAIPICLIVGLIFGLIFAALYRHLPGGTSIKKALFISLIFWIVLSLIPMLTIMRPILFALPTYVAAQLITGFISVIIYGLLLGKLWDVFAH